jgi:signal transduction histidine kinase
MPAAVLFLTLGVAVAALLEARKAALSDHDATRDLVKGHGAFAAWAFGREAEDRLAAMVQPILASRGGAAIAFRIPVDAGEPVWSGGIESNVRRALSDAVQAHARRIYRDEWRFAMLQVRHHQVVYTVRVDAGRRVAYGFLVGESEYVRLFGQIMATEPLLPPSLKGGMSDRDLLLVQVIAADGRVIFSSRGERWGAGVEEPMSPEFGGMKVYASVQQEAAFALIVGDFAPSRLPLLAGLLALGMVTGMVALALLRRDAALARVRSDFVSSVSHELRTPLAQIRLFLETLRLGRYRTDEQREWILDNIERESFRLAALVDNILHFSSAERGTTGGVREPVAVGPYLESIIEAFAPIAQSKNVRITLNVNERVYGLLHADSFRQVMLNLFDNAIKYGPAGQTLNVEAAPRTDSVVISVDDAGPGVDSRERSLIFDPFRRGDRAIESATAGSGIGLAVVREIVEWHGGTVRVETGSRGGAKFVVQIPRCDVSARTHGALHQVR